MICAKSIHSHLEFAHRVLIVGKNAELQGGLIEILGHNGFHTKFVRGPSAAEKSLGQFDPQVCLVDSEVYQSDGFKLIDKLKGRRPELPFMLMADQGWTAPSQTGPDEPCAGILFKPIGERDLMAALECCMAKIESPLPGPGKFTDSGGHGARFRNLIEESPRGVIVHREDKLLFVNSAFARLLGYDSPELLMENVGSIREVLYTEIFESTLPHARYPGEGQPGAGNREVGLLHRNGSIVWAELSMRNVIWNGEPANQTACEDITGQKKAEINLRKSERRAIEAQTRLMDAIESVSEGFIMFDADDRLVLCNNRYREFYPKLADLLNPGVELNEVVRAELERRAVNYPSDGFDQWERNRLEQHRKGCGEHEQHLSDGRWLLCTDRKTTGGGTVGIRTEITQLKQQESELRSSQRLLQTVFDVIPHQVFVKDTESRYVMVNDAFAENVNLQAHHVCGLSTHDLHGGNEEDYNWNLDSDREVLESGEQLHLEDYSIALPDGTQRISSMHKMPLRDDTGAIVGLVGISEDISARRGAEVALRESESRFRCTFDNSPSAIFLKDLNGAFQLTNGRFEEWCGLPADEVVGKSTHDLYPRHLADKFAAQDTDVLANGVVIKNEIDILLSDGNLHRISYSKFPVLGGDQQLIGVGTVATDVTEHRKVEHQLREAQKMEAVGQLAGGIAHDFNNVLQVITSYAHFARSNAHDAKAIPKYLDAVIRASEHAANLTRQLLTFSRRRRLQTKSLNLNELTAELMKMVGRFIGAHIELEFTPCEYIHQVEADPGMLEQVILNLSVNARHAMPEGGRLLIGTDNFVADQEFCDNQGWEHPGKYVVLTVSDNGIGMPAEVCERIFEPFFTTKEVGEGTGLGMAMVYGIVQQHGGKIDIQSEPGVGTVFKIFLPAGGLEALAQEAPATREATGGNETILVAEDEEAVRELMRDALQSKGYDVFTACDGVQAVKAFKKNAKQIDLVLLDLVMPKLKGRGAYEQIKRIQPEIGVLFSTGYPESTADEEFLSGSGSRLIQKPYSPNQLLCAVREALDARKQ